MRVGAATSGPAITAAGDSRITTVGRVLRRTKLDELPQLLNVLKGEMSIVGPRPEDPRYVASYSRRERQVLQWRPGITSPASIKYRNEEAVLASMGGDVESAYVVLAAEKIETDLAYLQRRSVLGDLKLVIRTAIAVIGR